MRLLPLAFAAALLAHVGAAWAASAITIVAAENFYGDLAAQVAGPYASVVSVLSNPDQDPHLFEADAKTARALADARVVISNGADYDPWMEKLLGASKGRDRTVIVAADLVGRKAGDNPHVWYDPATMTAVAQKLADDLGRVDTAHEAEYQANAKRFAAGLQPLEAKIAAMRKTFSGTPVTASEPVFGYMAGLLGLDMRNQKFQTAVMNNTEPSPADVAAFEDDLRNHKVRVMLHNSQAEGAAVQRLVRIAEEAHVPVVGVSETEPAGKSYEAWMLGQLTMLEQALSSGRS
jgi:zinc/manganese transport system substrate-binding protein